MRRPALLVAALALLAPLAVSAAQGPATGSLPHGGTYTVVRDNTLASAAIDLWFRAPGDGYDDAQPGISRLAATAAAAATLESGRSLVNLVRDAGGRIAINVYPDLVDISASVPASAARRVVAAMSAAYFAPAIDDDSLKIARTDVAVLSAQQHYSPDDLLHDALFAQLFASGPAHYAPIPGDLSDFKDITLAQVQAFAKRAFRSANATFALAGNVDTSLFDAVTAGAPGSPDGPILSSPAPAPVDKTITAAVSGEGVAWTGPPISDERAATAMDFIADYLFRDGTGVVSKALDPTGDSYVNGQFITLHDPGVMLVTIGGSKPADVEASVLAAIAKLEQPLDPATFAAAREAFMYHLAADTQVPSAQADNLGWYTAEGNGSYAPSDASSTYWKAARSLDPQFVASVVKKYLAHPVVVRLITPTSKESTS
ncbi:MAG TPA: insulinase family protein [Candidatus Acidoferrales bacterium]|nr:insulinase family protein [Candidatus Acidoferrales bacterium]